MTDHNGWNRYELMVINRLNALDKNYKELHVGLENLRIEIATLRVFNSAKMTFLGIVGGLLPAIGAAIYFFLSR